MAKNMTEGKPLKLILAFMFPVLCGNLFQNFYKETYICNYRVVAIYILLVYDSKYAI